MTKEILISDYNFEITMATGHSKRSVVIMPTRLPGPPVVPTVLAAPSSAVGKIQ